MAAREKRGERQLDDVFFAFHYRRDGAQEPGKARAGVGGRCLQLARPSATKSQYCGRLAQWLERSPHTGEVQGSSPWSPTTNPTYKFYHHSLDEVKRRTVQVCSKGFRKQIQSRREEGQRELCMVKRRGASVLEKD